MPSSGDITRINYLNGQSLIFIYMVSYRAKFRYIERSECGKELKIGKVFMK